MKHQHDFEKESKQKQTDLSSGKTEEYTKSNRKHSGGEKFQVKDSDSGKTERFETLNKDEEKGEGLDKVSGDIYVFFHDITNRVTRLYPIPFYSMQFYPMPFYPMPNFPMFFDLFVQLSDVRL